MHISTARFLLKWEHDINASIVTDSDQEIVDLISAGITQKITRCVDDNSERLAAVFRCDFQPDQSRYIVNIPIHPPLISVPEVEAVVLNASARTRVTNCEKFGVRIEVVCNEPSDEPKQLFLEAMIYANHVG